MTGPLNAYDVGSAGVKYVDPPLGVGGTLDSVARSVAAVAGVEGVAGAGEVVADVGARLTGHASRQPRGPTTLTP